MRTTLYLVRHAATDWNLATPARLQGRRHDVALAAVGVLQAEATRDVFAARPIDICYTSPLLRAAQTASILAAPHGLEPVPCPDLVECDVGSWEGRTWDDVRARDGEAYARFLADPAHHGYPGGENLHDVSVRVNRAMEQLFRQHDGQSILVVSHHAVNRVYLAGLLGLPPARARHVSLDNCGISVVLRDGDRCDVSILNAAFHLQGVAA